MKKELIIVGADDAIELAELCLVPQGYILRGYLRPEKSEHGLSAQFEYLGTDDQITEGAFSGTFFLLALSSSKRCMDLHEMVMSSGNDVISLIHPSSTIYPSAEILEGSLVLPHAIVSSMARVGKCVNIGYSALVGHDVSVGDYAFISPGVKLLGGSIVGKGADIGTNSVIFPNIEVGANCTVAANSVVTHDVSAGSTVIPQHGKNRILKGPGV
ncbi:MAG: acetyltransferase [Candidatus Pacearchaeota archaeon]|nr:acetyltransferase [Candidatus Pacearchaeota archaeon]